MLCYRAGLRRNEALKLRLKDIQDGSEVSIEHTFTTDKPELLVRSSIYHNLKTTKSLRRLPLHTLLYDDELSMLRLWKKSRVDECAEQSCGNKLLFCKDGMDTTPLQDTDTFAPICKILQEVTGDPTIRPHYLRHSFTNFTLLRLMESELDIANDCYTEREICDIPHLRNNITIGPEASSTRRLLYELSRLCGHLDPTETLATYTHVADYLLGLFLRKNNEDLTLSQQATLLDLSPKKLKAYRNRHRLKGKNSPTDLLFSEAYLQRKKLADPILKTMSEFVIPKSITHSDNTQQQQVPNPIRMYNIFRQYHSGLYTIQRLSETHLFPENEITSWIKMGAYLANNEINDLHRGLVPNMVTFSAKGQKTVQTKIIPLDKLHLRPAIPGLCPAPPHAIRDRKESIAFYNGIIKLYQNDQPLALEGLKIYTRNPSWHSTRPVLRKDSKPGRYVEFLKAIGVPKSRIRINLRATPKKNVRDQKKYWVKLLSLPPTCFVKITKYKRQPKGFDFGKIEIWIAGLPRPGNHGVPTPKKITYPANSVKFAFFMAAVYLGAKIMKSKSQQSDTVKPKKKIAKKPIARAKTVVVENEAFCPRCNKSMVLRTAKKGKNAGMHFWGCGDFPKCKGFRKF